MSALSRPHAARLKQYLRSAGWPSHDSIELDLLAAGLLERRIDAAGRDTLVVTQAGIEALHRQLSRNRAAFGPHEALVARTADWLVANQRLVFLAPAFRVKVDEAWCIARPDVFSIRHTTREDYLRPIAYEIKVRRADLLGDLRKPAKRACYQQVSAEFYYVVLPGIATADDIPEDCGLIEARDAGLATLRVSPSREPLWDFSRWMSLIRAQRHREQEQVQLGL
jgi:hypothetical protein